MPHSFGIYYHESGEENTGRPPLLLLHGAGGTHLYWPPEIRRLKDCRVISLDLPGHGKSDGVSGLQRIEAYAEKVHDWMEEMKLQQAVIAGHSMGGAIALTLALLYPPSVAGLVMVSTGARLAVNPALLEETSSPLSFVNAVHTIIKWSFGSQASARLVELAQQRMAESRQSVLHGDLRACNEFDVVNQLGKIDCPTLIICGCEDRMTPCRSSQYLASHISKARLHLIPDAGHMVMLEKPREVARAFETFLQELAYPREVF